jgi:hypothetical protein
MYLCESGKQTLAQTKQKCLMPYKGIVNTSIADKYYKNCVSAIISISSIYEYIPILTKTTRTK